MHIHHGFSTPTRKSAYSFGFQDSSVYADFNINLNKCLYLIRISFDGYGCCYPDWIAEPLEINQTQSLEVLKMLEENDFDNPKMSSIFSSYFKSCGNAIWKDALKEHNLV